jgi:hypothetical protein
MVADVVKVKLLLVAANFVPASFGCSKIIKRQLNNYYFLEILKVQKMVKFVTELVSLQTTILTNI